MIVSGSFCSTELVDNVITMLKTTLRRTYDTRSNTEIKAILMALTSMSFPTGSRSMSAKEAMLNLIEWLLDAIHHCELTDKIWYRTFGHLDTYLQMTYTGLKNHIIQASPEPFDPVDLDDPTSIDNPVHVKKGEIVKEDPPVPPPLPTWSVSMHQKITDAINNDDVDALEKVLDTLPEGLNVEPYIHRALAEHRLDIVDTFFWHEYCIELSAVNVIMDAIMCVRLANAGKLVDTVIHMVKNYRPSYDELDMCKKVMVAAYSINSPLSETASEEYGVIYTYLTNIIGFIESPFDTEDINDPDYVDEGTESDDSDVSESDKDSDEYVSYDDSDAAGMDKVESNEDEVKVANDDTDDELDEEYVEC